MNIIRQDILNAIITESVVLTDCDSIKKAINSNQAGVKILPEYKNNINVIGHPFTIFINKCNSLKVKNITYGVQFLLSHVKPSNLYKAINSDAIYEYLRDKQKPWAKDMPIFKEFESSEFDETIWHNFEKTMQAESEKHGKSNKGSGKANASCEKYNDGNWSLEIPNSFEEEKAIAFYYDENDNKTPTHWCTRADKNYYDHYTQNGKTHLYVIKNLKLGRSYQLAFMRNSVEFLDDQDERGDEITRGDLSKIPDKLLSLIKDENEKNGRTLLDFKNALNSDGIETKKYVSAKNTFSFEKFNPKFGTIENLNDNIRKAPLLNFSKKYYDDKMSDYFDSVEDLKIDEEYTYGKDAIYNKKDYMVAYWHKDFPKAILLYKPEDKSWIESQEYKDLKYSNPNAYSELNKEMMADFASNAKRIEDRIERRTKENVNDNKQNYIGNYDGFRNKGLRKVSRHSSSGDFFKELIGNEIEEYIGSGFKHIDVRNKDRRSLGMYGNSNSSYTISNTSSVSFLPSEYLITNENDDTIKVAFLKYDNGRTTEYVNASYSTADFISVNGEKKEKSSSEFKFWYELSKKLVRKMLREKLVKDQIDKVKENRNSDTRNKDIKPVFEHFEY